MQYNHIFNQHWQIYQTILRHDYMGHSHAFAHVREALLADASRLRSVLDVGSGDAQTLTAHLADIAISSYSAIDLSVEALSIAQQNVAQLGCQLTAINRDFNQALVELAEQGAQFDIIFSGFALHHVDNPQKLKLMSLIKQLLSEQGIFVYVDVCHRAGESREAYLARYLTPTMQWTALSEAEREVLHTHVRTSDYPADQMTLMQMGEQAGFSDVECLLYDDACANVVLAMR